MKSSDIAVHVVFASDVGICVVVIQLWHPCLLSWEVKVDSGWTSTFYIIEEKGSFALTPVNGRTFVSSCIKTVGTLSTQNSPS